MSNNTMLSFYEMQFPILDVNGKFFLREQSLEDAEAFFHYYSDPVVSQYILASIPRTKAQALEEILYCKNLFKYKKGIFWSLATSINNLMVGAVGLYINNQHRRAEISYDLNRSFWNQGLMTHTLQCVLNFAFSNMGIKRVEAITTKENVPSIKLLQKLGFSYEGCLKNYRYYQGRAYDVELFAITPKI